MHEENIYSYMVFTKAIYENTFINLGFKKLVSTSNTVMLEGGIDSIDDIPSNVSVNGYTLNKNMYVPLEGTITSEFGSRIHPVSGELSFHAGVDIAGDTGEPIYSAFDGEVIVADYDQWNGYYLKIIHDGNIMTVYCHCNKIYVECGDLVKAGDIIAEVGSTGTSTGPHLHFEFRIDNVSYDPKIALEIAKNEV
jgi:murein DD-endopeptidase MepM/ murein hydrolase activator NlpD